MNGTIEAVTRSYTEPGETKFGAMIPERSLHAGANDVSVYAVNGKTLTELPAATSRTRSGPARSQASDGTTVRSAGPSSGEVRGTRSASGSTLGGWAANMKSRSRPSSIVVLVDGKSVFVGDNGNIPRKDILKRYGVDKAGFIFRLPGSLLPDAGRRDRCACSRSPGKAASELQYLRGYPWKTQ